MFNFLDTQVVQRFFSIVFASASILMAATGCTFPSFGGVFGSNSITYGILKQEKSKSGAESGFARANAVQTSDDGKNVNAKGLSDQKIIKLLEPKKDNLYALSQQKGLFKTIDGGVIWRRKYIYDISSSQKDANAKNTEINNKIAKNDNLEILDFALETTSNSIYISGIDENKIGKIFRSSNGGDTFSSVYTEVEKEVAVTKIVTNATNANTILAVLSGGGLIRSFDGGNNWQKIYTFATAPTQIDFLPYANNIMYALLPDSGLYFSTDQGQTWTINTLNLGEAAKKDDNTNNNFLKTDNANKISNFKQIYFIQNGNYEQKSKLQNKTIPELEIYLIANSQLWYAPRIDGVLTRIVLPLQQDQSNILALAYDPINGSQNIKVSVDNKLLESSSRGSSWAIVENIRADETIGDINSINYGFDNSDILYLGLGTSSKQKKGLFG